MATSYYQGKKALDYLSKQSTSLKSAMTVLKKYIGNSNNRFKLHLTLEDNNGIVNAKAVYKNPNIYQIKINPTDTRLLNELSNFLMEKKFKLAPKSRQKSGSMVSFEAGFQFYISGKKLKNVIDESGNAIGNTSPSNDQQEDGFLYNLQKNKLMSPGEINEAIGFEFNKKWHHSFKVSYVGFTKHIISQSNLKNYNFYRDSSKKKPKMLNLITDSKVLPYDKDNWNPSDIWCVKKSSAKKLEVEIIKLHNDLKNSNISIETLNKFIEEKFNSGELLGVSLKEVTSNTAKVIKVIKDADYINSIKFKRMDSSLFNFNVDKSYFEIKVIMSCLKSNNLSYNFKFRPRGSSGSLTQNAEGVIPNLGTADGAIDKRNVIKKYFPDADNIATQGLSEHFDFKRDNTMNKALLHLEPKYDKFIDWVNKGKCSIVNIQSLDVKILNENYIKRGLLNLYYVYLIDTYSNKKELFKNFYLAAKKINEFSSIHYKISS